MKTLGLFLVTALSLNSFELQTSGGTTSKKKEKRKRKDSESERELAADEREIKKCKAVQVVEYEAITTLPSKREIEDVQMSVAQPAEKALGRMILGDLPKELVDKVAEYAPLYRAELCKACMSSFNVLNWRLSDRALLAIGLVDETGQSIGLTNKARSKVIRICNVKSNRYRDIALRRKSSDIKLVASSDGGRLAEVASGLQVRIWNTETGSRELSFMPDGMYDSATWSSDGTRLALGSSDRICIWDVAHNVHMRSFACESAGGTLAWSPDATRLASLSVVNHSTLDTPALKKVFVWDVSTGLRVAELQSSASLSLSSIAWSPNGAWLASADNDGKIGIWNTTTWQQVGLFSPKGAFPSISSLVWSPDSCRLVLIAGNNMGVWRVRRISQPL